MAKVEVDELVAWLVTVDETIAVNVENVVQSVQQLLADKSQGSTRVQNVWSTIRNQLATNSNGLQVQGQRALAGVNGVLGQRSMVLLSVNTTENHNTGTMVLAQVQGVRSLGGQASLLQGPWKVVVRVLRGLLVLVGNTKDTETVTAGSGKLKQRENRQARVKSQSVGVVLTLGSGAIDILDAERVASVSHGRRGSWVVSAGRNPKIRRTSVKKNVTLLLVGAQIHVQEVRVLGVVDSLTVCTLGVLWLELRSPLTNRKVTNGGLDGEVKGQRGRRSSTIISGLKFRNNQALDKGKSEGKKGEELEHWRDVGIW